MSLTIFGLLDRVVESVAPGGLATNLANTGFAGSLSITPHAPVPLTSSSVGLGWLRIQSPFLLDQNEVEVFGQDWKAWSQALLSVDIGIRPGTVGFLKDVGGFRLSALQRDYPPSIGDQLAEQGIAPANGIEAARLLIQAVVALDIGGAEFGIDPELTHYAVVDGKLVYCRAFPPLISPAQSYWYMQRFASDHLHPQPGCVDPRIIDPLVSQRHSAPFILHEVLCRVGQLLPEASAEIHRFARQTVEEKDPPHREALLAAIFGELPIAS